MVSGSVLFLGLRDYQAMVRIIIPWINREVSNLIWLVVWIMNFMTFHILGMSSSQLTNSIIFQRGRYTTNQLPSVNLT